MSKGDLTVKQDNFCKEFIVGFNATKAAIRAGYSEKTARSQGQRLLTNVDIQKRIKQLVTPVLKDIENRTAITKDELVKNLLEIRDLFKRVTTIISKPVEEITAKEKDHYEMLIKFVRASDLNKSIDQITKMYGFYAAEKVEVSFTSNWDLSKLTDSEKDVLRKLQKKARVDG